MKPPIRAGIHGPRISTYQHYLVHLVEILRGGAFVAPALELETFPASRNLKLTSATPPNSKLEANRVEVRCSDDGVVFTASYDTISLGRGVFKSHAHSHPNLRGLPRWSYMATKFLQGLSRGLGTVSWACTRCS
jgi:hypothetical protein